MSMFFHFLYLKSTLKSDSIATTSKTLQVNDLQKFVLFDMKNHLVYVKIRNYDLTLIYN